MIINTITSLDKCEGLHDCDKLIMCNGYKISTKDKLKREHVTVLMAINYEQFIINLQNQIKRSNPIVVYVDVHIQNKRNGFTENIRLALQKVTTPFVMIVQHDHQINRSIFNKEHIHHDADDNVIMKTKIK